jgi:hypothetical protein
MLIMNGPLACSIFNTYIVLKHIINYRLFHQRIRETTQQAVKDPVYDVRTFI